MIVALLAKANIVACRLLSQIDNWIVWLRCSMCRRIALVLFGLVWMVVMSLCDMISFAHVRCHYMDCFSVCIFIMWPLFFFSSWCFCLVSKRVGVNICLALYAHVVTVILSSVWFIGFHAVVVCCVTWMLWDLRMYVCSGDVYLSMVALGIFGLLFRMSVHISVTPACLWCLYFFKDGFACMHIFHPCLRGHLYFCFLRWCRGWFVVLEDIHYASL